MIDLERLSSGWWSFLGEFARPDPTLETYVRELAPRPHIRTLDLQFDWLRSAPVVQESLAVFGPGDPEPATPFDRPHLERLVAGSDVSVPEDVRVFAGDTSLRGRLRSGTACYLDLGQQTFPTADGGQMVHFLSDQQWVLHWLVCVGSASAGTVVGTPQPLGFFADEDSPRIPITDPAADAVVCASSFSEFIYRFWIENEIWFALHARRGLTNEQTEYLDGIQGMRT